MTRIRRIGAVVLAAPLAMGFPVFTVTVPAEAAAATAVLSPKNGAVITSGSEVTARAHSQEVRVELRVDVPVAGDTFLTERWWSGDLSAPISVRRNGRYRVYVKGAITGKIYDSNTFTVRIPPAQPSGVSAGKAGERLIVRWNLGLEDDLTGYRVNAGSAGSRNGSTGALCSGTSCSASFYLPKSASGSLPVRVQARRASGTGSSVYSNVASVTARLGNGSGGSGGGAPDDTPPSTPPPSYPPGTTPPPNPTAPLTPFNRNSPLTLPSVQPDGAAPGFTYPTPQVLDPNKPKATTASKVNSLRWGQSVGIALILLVIAAHLGTWTRRLRVAQAGVSSKGMAARAARGGSGRKRVRKARQHIAKAEAVAKTATLALPTEVTRGDAIGKPGEGGSAGEKGKAGRRPATPGKRSGGVNVRIAGTAFSAERPGGKGRHNGRGRRRGN